MLPAALRSDWGAVNSNANLATPALALTAAEVAQRACVLAVAGQRGSGIGTSCWWRPDPSIVDGSIDEPLTLLARPVNVNTDVELWLLEDASAAVPGGGTVHIVRNATTRHVLIGIIATAPNGVRLPASEESHLSGANPDLVVADAAPGDVLIGCIGREGADPIPPDANGTLLQNAGAGGGTASPIGAHAAWWSGDDGATVGWIAGSASYALAAVALAGPSGGADSMGDVNRLRRGLGLFGATW